MKHAGSYRYTALIAGVAFISTLTVCAAGQSNPASPPVPVSTTSPTNSANSISSAQPSQRMAAGARRILALRRLLQLGFNTAECTRALRLLERLRDVRTAPPDDPEKALEEEYRALLAARPTDPLPPSSAAKIMDAARFYRDEQAKVWADMTREIGAARAEGLRLLIGQGNNSAFYANRPRVGKTLPYTSDMAAAKATVPAAKNDITFAPKSGSGFIGQPQPNTNVISLLPNRQAIVIPSASETSDYTFVMYSLTTVRLSLDEMINLLREKIDAMNGKSSLRP